MLPLTDHSRLRYAHRDTRWDADNRRITVLNGEKYWAGSLPSLHGVDFRISLALDGEALGQGVLAELGDWNSGWAIIAREGRVSWLLNHVGGKVLP